jgi:hypothetical protein
MQEEDEQIGIAEWEEIRRGGWTRKFFPDVWQDEKVEDAIVPAPGGNESFFCTVIHQLFFSVGTSCV